MSVVLYTVPIDKKSLWLLPSMSRIINPLLRTRKDFCHLGPKLVSGVFMNLKHRRIST